MHVRRVSIRSLSAGLALVFATALLAACVPVPTAGAPAAAADWQSEMISAVNAQRDNAGVAPVQRCASLERAAQAHSEDQAASGTMSHTGTDGSALRVRVERNGYAGWTGIAENVAAGQPDTGSVMGAWMNSDGHRRNLLASRSTHIGVGRAQSSDGTWYWTQDFGASGSC